MADFLNNLILWIMSFTFEPLGQMIVEYVIAPIENLNWSKLLGSLVMGLAGFAVMWAFYTVTNDDFNGN